MTPFDENPSNASEQPPAPEPAPEPAMSQPSLPEPEASLAGDPIPYVGGAPAASYTPKPGFPEDLQVSWSWPHLIVFLVFAFASLMIVQTTLAVYYTPHQHLSRKELEQYLLSKPQFAVGSMVLWYAALFLFLYVTLSVLRNLPFWHSLGWKKIQPRDPAQPKNPLLYFFSGCGLSLFVALATARIQPPEHLPLQDIFKHRSTALSFMALAVIVAPLVEETIFRGYLYPLFARSFGVMSGILITGVLFGLMHGAQLGWTWSLVSLLIFVGIIFTFVRARTGTVLASYLLHLGYNSLIVATTLLGTRGFTRMPPGH
jgi:membrane protease YdiL (CAAX protease family)